MDEPKPYPCCNVEANLELKPAPGNPPEGLEMRVCRECGRRHFEIDADKVDLAALAFGL